VVTVEPPSGLSLVRFRQLTNSCSMRRRSPKRTSVAATSAPTTSRARHSSQSAYLHKLLEADGLSGCEWIRTTPLEHCRSDLADPAIPECTILEIASRLASRAHRTSVASSTLRTAARLANTGEAPPAPTGYENDAADADTRSVCRRRT